MSNCPYFGKGGGTIIVMGRILGPSLGNSDRSSDGDQPRDGYCCRNNDCPAITTMAKQLGMVTVLGKVRSSTWISYFPPIFERFTVEILRDLLKML